MGSRGGDPFRGHSAQPGFIIGGVWTRWYRPSFGQNSPRQRGIAASGSAPIGTMTQSLRGQFLIAGKRLRDPNFLRTVVLMVEHGKEGAMGLIVNRPSSVTVAHALSEHFKLPETDDLVYVGGPVEPSALFILHNAPEMDHTETPIIPGLFVGSSAEVFESIVRSAAEGKDRLKFRIYSGCAGWSPGQLEGELSRGDWYLHDANCECLFTDDPYQVWERMLHKVYEANRILPQHPANPEWN